MNEIEVKKILAKFGFYIEDRVAVQICQLFSKETNAINYLEGYLERRESKPDEGRLLTRKDIRKVIIEYGLTRNISYDPKYFTHNMPEFMHLIKAQDAECQARVERIFREIEYEGLYKNPEHILLSGKEWQARKKKEGVK